MMEEGMKDKGNAVPVATTGAVFLGLVRIGPDRAMLAEEARQLRFRRTALVVDLGVSTVELVRAGHWGGDGR